MQQIERVESSVTTLTIAVFGGTGTAGRQVVEQALADGHAVVVLTRDPTKAADLVARGVRVEGGDVRRVEDVRRVVAGVDAVVVALGASARDRSGLRADGTRAVVDAMAAEGVERLVVLSVLGAGATRDSLDWFTRWVVFGLWLQPAIDDHTAADAIVRETSLRWTLVRPPHFKEGPATDRVVVGFPLTERPPAMSVHTGDLAAFLVSCAVSGAHVGEEVGIVTV